jgi:multiple antibiotic resistance protein
VNDLAFALTAIASVFAIVDPIGALPFYVSLTQDFDSEDRRIIRRRAILVLGAVLGLFAIAGRFLFAVFGFSLGAFEIAGGILLFLVSYEMLQGRVARAKLTAQDRDEALGRRDEISVVPLGIPLLAGPGAISTVMIFEGTAGADPWAIAATFVAIAITVAATYVAFRFGEQIFSRLGRVGTIALSRVMGLLLAAVGIQFVITGVTTILSTLPGH